MRTNLFKTAAFTLVAIFFFGCISSIDKRRYRKGYHFAHSSHIKTKPGDRETQKPNEPVETVVVLPQETTLPFKRYSPTAQRSEKPGLKKVRHHNPELNESDTHTAIIKARAVFDIEKETIAPVTSSIATETRNVSGLWYFLGLLLIPFAGKFKSANDIARWSQQNKKTSRTLVTLANAVGIGAGFGLGYMGPFNIEQWMLAIPAALSVTGFCLYHSKAPARQKMERKRMAYGLLSLNGSFGALVLGSQFPGSDNPFVNHPAANVVFTILMLAALAIAGFLIMILACNLACSGLEVLAVMVGVGGGFAAIYLFALGVAYIWMREKDDATTLRNRTWRIILAMIVISLFITLVAVTMA